MGDDRQGTATMARLFAEQGHWDKAADIYRHLLDREPGREDLSRALAEAETQMAAVASESRRDLVPLFQEWLDLLLKFDQIRKLRRISRRL